MLESTQHSSLHTVGAHRTTKAVESEHEIGTFPCGFCAVGEDKLRRDRPAGVME